MATLHLLKLYLVSFLVKFILIPELTEEDIPLDLFYIPL